MREELREHMHSESTMMTVYKAFSINQMCTDPLWRFEHMWVLRHVFLPSHLLLLPVIVHCFSGKKQHLPAGNKLS